jgi:hypothetical protein
MLSIYKKKYAYTLDGKSLVFVIDDEKTKAKHRLTLNDTGTFEEKIASRYSPLKGHIVEATMEMFFGKKNAKTLKGHVIKYTVSSDHPRNEKGERIYERQMPTDVYVDACFRDHEDKDKRVVLSFWYDIGMTVCSVELYKFIRSNEKSGTWDTYDKRINSDGKPVCLWPSEESFERKGLTASGFDLNGFMLPVEGAVKAYESIADLTENEQWELDRLVNRDPCILRYHEGDGKWKHVNFFDGKTWRDGFEIENPAGKRSLLVDEDTDSRKDRLKAVGVEIGMHYGSLPSYDPKLWANLCMKLDAKNNIKEICHMSIEHAKTKPVRVEVRSEDKTLIYTTITVESFHGTLIPVVRAYQLGEPDFGTEKVALERIDETGYLW